MEALKGRGGREHDSSIHFWSKLPVHLPPATQEAFPHLLSQLELYFLLFASKIYKLIYGSTQKQEHELLTLNVSIIVIEMVLVFKLFKVKNTWDLWDLRNTKYNLQGVDSEVSVTPDSRWLFNGWRRHNYPSSCPIHLSVTVASPSGLQVSAPENWEKKSVQKGICKWNMLWTGLLCSRGKGEFSTHTLDFLFLFCILYPILAPTSPLKGNGKNRLHQSTR